MAFERGHSTEARLAIPVNPACSSNPGKPTIADIIPARRSLSRRTPLPRHRTGYFVLMFLFLLQTRRHAGRCSICSIVHCLVHVVGRGLMWVVVDGDTDIMSNANKRDRMLICLSSIASLCWRLYLSRCFKPGAVGRSVGGEVPVATYSPAICACACTCTCTSLFPPSCSRIFSSIYYWM